MATYLLLRDNKQSGPYTFDELKEKGLKAYDLVWLEGKSAAWRYPSEIEELSAFAPAVEEQPFDRFYKKPSQNTVSSNNNTTTLPPQDKIAASVISGDASAVPGKRIIYVTLPAGRTASAAPAREVISTPVPQEKYLPTPAPAPQPMLPDNSFEENTAQYQQDWQAHVEIAPRSGYRRHNSRIGQRVMVGLTVIALLSAGIFIGLSINKDSLGLSKMLSFGNTGKENKTGPVKKTLTEAPPHTLAVNTQPPAQPAPVSDSILLSKPAETKVSAPPAVTAKNSVPVREKTAAMTQKGQTTLATPKDSLLAVPAVHREASHRGDLSEEKVEKDVLKNNLSNLVSLGSSGYTVGTFGGISGLQLTVSNRSVYALDLVVVEVQYIQANKKVFKTENLYFRSIAPGSALMQEAPKSSRGIKVAYKITLVNSKELGLSYSAL